MIEIILNLFSVKFLLVLLLFLVICAFVLEYKKQVCLPPGPWGLPFFGYAFFLDRQNMSEELMKVGHKYKSDIISVTMFGSTYIILNSYDMAKEVFQKRADVADRIPLSFFSVFDDGYTGIVTTSGSTWKIVRRFSINMLNDLGVKGIAAEEIVRTESYGLVEIFKSFKGKAFDIQEHVIFSMSNIICGIVFGRRFSHDDAEFHAALTGIRKLNEALTGNVMIMCYLYGFSIFKNFFLKDKYQTCQRNYNVFNEFVKKRIEEHKEQDTDEVTDMVYGFLKEKREGSNEDIFDDKMLESLITDYFFAGTETGYTMIRWCVLAMAAFPEIQQKVQEELDEMVPDRPICMNDRVNTPYTHAVICEIMRYFTIAPLGGVRTTFSEDVMVNGYKIPRNSLVCANIRALHRSEEDWKNPNEFDPYNFLENGEVANLPKFVPFSIGRRSCPADNLAKIELYICFGTLMKEFKILPETDDCAPDLIGTDSGVYMPKPYKVRMIPRNDER